MIIVILKYVPADATTHRTYLARGYLWMCLWQPVEPHQNDDTLKKQQRAAINQRKDTNHRDTRALEAKSPRLSLKEGDVQPPPPQ